MPPGRDVELQFPAGGVVRRLPHQYQPPYMTPDAMNVRADDAIEGVSRGGSRPGLVEHMLDLITGDTQPITLMNSRRVIETDYWTQWFDNFDGDQAGSNWTALPNAEYGDTISSSMIGGGLLAVPGQSPVEVYGPDPSHAMDDDGPTATRVVEMRIIPKRGVFTAGRYRLFCRMNDAPSYTGRYTEVELTLTASGTYSGTLTDRYYDGSWTEDVTTFSGSTPVMPTLFTARIRLDGAGGFNVSVYLNASRVLAQTAVYAAARTMFGFGVIPNSASETAYIDFVRYIYRGISGIRPVDQVVAGRKATVSTEKYPNWISRVTMGYTDDSPYSVTMEISGDNPIESVNRQGTLFIADWHKDRFYLQVKGNDEATGPMRGIHTRKITDHEIASFFGGPLTQEHESYVVSYLDPSGRFVTSGHLQYYEQLTTISAYAGDTRWVIYGQGAVDIEEDGYIRIERSPKRLVGDVLQRWQATSGSVPAGCRLINLYRDRVTLAGAEYAPHAWYMARQGDPYDWDYSQTDAQAAVAGDAADAGDIGDAMSALVVASDDYMLFGCTRSIWILRGDPKYGGSLDALSRDVGILSARAHTTTEEGGTAFLSHAGLYFLPPGGQSYPAALSPDRLPRDLREINPEEYWISMAWDPHDRGILIFLTSNGGTRMPHWFFDWENKGFMPFEFASSDYDPWTVCRRVSGAGEEIGPLLGCSDGRMRHFSRWSGSDCGERFNSYVLYGPLYFGGTKAIGYLRTLDCILSRDSGPVVVSLLLGDSPEAALDSDEIFLGQWSSGRNYRQHVRRRGHVGYLKVSGGERTGYLEHDSDEGLLELNSDGGLLQLGSEDAAAFRARWAVERLVANIRGAGKVRML